MTLEENDIHIWRYTLDEAEYHAEKTAPIMSVEEQLRCDEYLNKAEKIRYTCNHRFVRQVLAKYLNIAPAEVEFSHAVMGKPFLKQGNLFFNYSYRTTFGVLALSKTHEVGVDIENIKLLQDPPTFASFSFSENERELIFNSTPEKFQDTLFTFWTFKEAIIKALGVGLNADLTQIDLAPFFYSEFNSLKFDNDTLYTIKQIKALPGYKVAFAVKGTVNSFMDFDYVKS